MFESLTSSLRLSFKFLQEVKNNGYVNGMYFYVRDEKVLQLVQLIIGGNIKRVDKFINSALS